MRQEGCYIVKVCGLSLQTGWEGFDWIHLAQDTKEWWAVVCMVMNFRVS